MSLKCVSNNLHQKECPYRRWQSCYVWIYLEREHRKSFPVPPNILKQKLNISCPRHPVRNLFSSANNDSLREYLIHSEGLYGTAKLKRDGWAVVLTSLAAQQMLTAFSVFHSVTVTRNIQLKEESMLLVRRIITFLSLMILYSFIPGYFQCIIVFLHPKTKFLLTFQPVVSSSISPYLSPTWSYSVLLGSTRSYSVLLDSSSFGQSVPSCSLWWVIF